MPVVYKLEVLGHFTDWNIFLPEVLKIFKDKAFYFKSIYHKIIVQNLYKFWSQNVPISQEAKCLNTPNLYTASN